jgi:hypothetical protein
MIKMDQIFLKYVYDGNLEEAKKLYDLNVEFILEDGYMDKLILEGKLDSVKFLDDLAVTIYNDTEPILAVKSNNMQMVKYFINKKNLSFWGLKYKQSLKHTDNKEIIDYIKSILNDNE